jgi:hypothetical protein
LRQPGGDPNAEAWQKLLTHVTALDYNTRFQFAHTGHELVMLLNTARRNTEVGLRVSSDQTVAFRYRMDVSHRLNQFLQGAVGLRNHIKKILEVRATITTRDIDVTKGLNRALGQHSSAGPISLVYALSNVFRHELVPGTIILESHWAGPLAERATFEVRTLLGMSGLIGGRGWNKTSEKYANKNNPIEVLPLAETYRRDIRNLVGYVVAEVREETRQRYGT